MIDPATSFFEVRAAKNATAAEAANIMWTVWLTRYPKPVQCIHDSGTEFTGFEFDDLLHKHGIKNKTASTRNPQSNAVLERMHAVLVNSLRAFELNPSMSVSEHNPFEDMLAAVWFAINSTYHTVNQFSPGQMAYG
jgi:transposase InsO family protein